MKVILKEAMENLGDAGAIVDVKPGYARNYLLPQGKAYVASDENMAKLEEERRRAEERAKREYLESNRRAAQLENATVTFAVNAAEEGKLFGSVTNGDIADKLNAEAGLDFEVEKRTVQLEDPIKELGEYRVEVKLHAEVSAEVEVVVVSADA